MQEKSPTTRKTRRWTFSSCDNRFRPALVVRASTHPRTPTRKQPGDHNSLPDPLPLSYRVRTQSPPWTSAPRSPPWTSALPGRLCELRPPRGHRPRERHPWSLPSTRASSSSAARGHRPRERRPRASSAVAAICGHCRFPRRRPRASSTVAAICGRCRPQAQSAAERRDRSLNREPQGRRALWRLDDMRCIALHFCCFLWCRPAAARCHLPPRSSSSTHSHARLLLLTPLGSGLRSELAGSDPRARRGDGRL